MSKTLLVFGEKTFRVTVPDSAKITFGPWSPPTGEGRYNVTERSLSGTLRVYENNKSGATILAVFSGVSGYRDLSLDYEEQVVREEGAVIWKSDKDGYKREENVKQEREWTDPLLEDGGHRK